MAANLDLCDLLSLKRVNMLKCDFIFLFSWTIPIFWCSLSIDQIARPWCLTHFLTGGTFTGFWRWWNWRSSDFIDQYVKLKQKKKRKKNPWICRITGHVLKFKKNWIYGYFVSLMGHSPFLFFRFLFFHFSLPLQ